MPLSETVSKTDLSRRTRQIVERARRGHTLIVESYGEEQVAIMDVFDYRLLHAVAAYHTRPHPPDDTATSQGLSERQMQSAIEHAGGDVQAGWDRVIAAYLDGDISLGRAADLLELSRFELRERFNRLNLPLRLGPADAEEARAERDALRDR
ncbi:MAG: type II toxin-antitoxin system prevent-host-death family antitoxin [Candidatus Promineifilaceae bacterium]|nr:type II toxin-antitoxin system prevent-host-death family antitoxin [Candidatus Promineifilaceae bacterium]